MERYYDDDQDCFFREAHVINPFNKPNNVTKPKLKKSGTEECEICFLFFPPSVSEIENFLPLLLTIFFGLFSR